MASECVTTSNNMAEEGTENKVSSLDRRTRSWWMISDVHLDITGILWHVKWTKLQTEIGVVVPTTTGLNEIVELFRCGSLPEHTNIYLRELLNDIYINEKLVRIIWPSAVHNTSKI